MSESQPYGGRLMFAQSWEDPECDRAALSIQPGRNVRERTTPHIDPAAPVTVLVVVLF